MNPNHKKIIKVTAWFVLPTLLVAAYWGYDYYSTKINSRPADNNDWDEIVKLGEKNNISAISKMNANQKKVMGDNFVKHATKGDVKFLLKIMKKNVNNSGWTEKENAKFNNVWVRFSNGKDLNLKGE